MNAAWSPDGNRIAFSSERKAIRDVYAKSSSGTGDEELVVQSGANKSPSRLVPMAASSLMAATLRTATGRGMTRVFSRFTLSVVCAISSRCVGDFGRCEQRQAEQDQQDAEN